MKKEAIRVSTTIPVAPTTLYYDWLRSEQHSAMTGSKAKIEGEVGTKFTAWDGYISGKLITLDLGRRIIMSWRTTEFPRDAHDSRVEVHLEALGAGTRLTILHTEIPEGQGEKYRAGWVEHYFDPMRRYFSKYLPDPRLPPPVRQPPPPMDDEEDEEESPKAKGKGAKGAPSKGVPLKGGPVKGAPSKGGPVKGAPVKGPGVAKVDKPVKSAKPPAKPAPKPPTKAANVPPRKAPAKPAAPAKKPAKPAKAPPKKPAKPAKAPAKKPAKKPAKPAKKPPAKKKR